MGGFFKKVAGAFVYLDEEPEKTNSSAPATRNLDDVARDANDLLAQLGGNRPEPVPTTVEAPARSSATNKSAMSMTADQVFSSVGIPDGPNSSQRVLKIIAGLTMFPKDQQIIMVRAMDAADETWSEKDVMEDARRRQSALRTHLQSIESERTQKLQVIAGRLEKSQADGKRRLDDIDQQIAELQKLRQEAVAAATSAMNELDSEKKQTEEAAEKSRRGITTVINALSELITFFTGGESRPTAKP